MTVQTTQRGFEFIALPTVNPDTGNETRRLVQQSSAIGDYENAMDRPGSSYLWLGRDHHLNREAVAELVEHLQAWLTTGRLSGKEGRR